MTFGQKGTIAIRTATSVKNYVQHALAAHVKSLNMGSFTTMSLPFEIRNAQVSGSSPLIGSFYLPRAARMS